MTASFRCALQFTPECSEGAPRRVAIRVERSAFQKTRVLGALQAFEVENDSSQSGSHLILFAFVRMLATGLHKLPSSTDKVSSEDEPAIAVGVSRSAISVAGSVPPCQSAAGL